MLEEMRRIAMVTSGVAELTKNKAEQIVRDLVQAGDVRRDQTSQMVKELVTRSAENRRELTGFVRSEIRAQLENLGVAGRRDVERLERRIARLEEAAKETKTAPKKATAKKTTRKKTTRKKTQKKTARKRSETKEPTAGSAAPSGDTTTSSAG